MARRGSLDVAELKAMLDAVQQDLFDILAKSSTTVEGLLTTSRHGIMGRRTKDLRGMEEV